MEIQKLTAQQRYYQKNKDKFIERVKIQRTQQKINKTDGIQTNEIETQTELEQIIVTKKPIRIIEIKEVHFPVLDFLIWTKKMTYVTVDIRDTTGEFVWNIQNKKQKIPNFKESFNHLFL